MAVVRISEDLKTGVRTNARNLFTDRIKAIWDNPPDVGEAIMSRLLGPYVETVKALPPGFIDMTDTFDLVRIGQTEYRTRLKTSSNYPTPDRDIRLPLGSVQGSSVPDIKLADDPAWDDVKAQMDEWMAKRKAVSAEQDAFIEGVMKVLEAHATLAPALKAWPPLWDLVPEEYKQRHRKVVERNKDEGPAAPEVDLNKLTATVAASKITR
jgi:hypothetical protein